MYSWDIHTGVFNQIRNGKICTTPLLSLYIPKAILKAEYKGNDGLYGTVTIKQGSRSAYHFGGFTVTQQSAAL